MRKQGKLSKTEGPPPFLGGGWMGKSDLKLLLYPIFIISRQDFHMHGNLVR